MLCKPPAGWLKIVSKSAWVLSLLRRKYFLKYTGCVQLLTAGKRI